MTGEFPTCKTCKFAEFNEYNERYFCKIQDENFDDEWGRNDQCYITKLDSFFCSEYQTRDGNRFVIWGDK